MTTASIPQLRPLGMGQLLDQAIRLYRRNFLKFIGIIAIVQIPLGLFQLGSSLLTFSGFSDSFSASSPSDLFGPAYFLGIAGNILAAILSYFLLQGVATGAMTQAIAGSYLGEPISIIEAYRKIGHSLLPLLGALLLAGVVAIGLVIWTIIPCIGWITGLGMLVFFAMVIMPLIAPTIVLEKQQATQAIRRAWDLSRRRFWWVIGFVLILTVFAQIIVTGPTMLIGYVFAFVFGNNPFMPASTHGMIIQTTVQSFVGIVGGLVYYPLQLTAITLMYFDLRIRTEGFDLTFLTESSSDDPTDVSGITAQAPPPETGNLMTMTELGYFALMAIGALALIIVLYMVLFAVLFSFMAAGSF